MLVPILKYDKVCVKDYEKIRDSHTKLCLSTLTVFQNKVLLDPLVSIGKTVRQSKHPEVLRPLGHIQVAKEPNAIIKHVWFCEMVQQAITGSPRAITP